MASDYLLELDGIKGESVDDKHKDTIEISSFSWGASNPTTSGGGGGGGGGKVQWSQMNFTTSVNKSSPTLMLYCANGTVIKKAVFYVRKQGAEQLEYYTITMENCVVASYNSGGSAGGSSIPTDSFSLDFKTFKFDYKPQKDDQSLDAAVTTGWDLGANKKLS